MKLHVHCFQYKYSLAYVATTTKKYHLQDIINPVSGVHTLTLRSSLYYCKFSFMKLNNMNFLITNNMKFSGYLFRCY